jgi:hypothetical protein
MTATYGPEHPRYESAQRFGTQLKTAMSRRRMRPFHLYKATGGGYSANQFHAWLTGAALPRLDTALRLAEALVWPALAEIAREARTSACERPGCGKVFFTEGGRTRKYCSPRCRQIVHEYYAGRHRDRKLTVTAQEGDLRAIFQEVKAGLEELDEHRSAVAAMCGSCEPEGYCRTPDCALRLVSPLPLLRDVPSRQRAGSVDHLSSRKAS